MFVPDQPVRFEPTFRSYIWGGHRLASQLGKKPPNDGIWAESWEIVDHPDAESVVSEGSLAGKTIRQLIQDFPFETTGQSSGTDRFPLLLKYLDCQNVLSVQVHPNDDYGAKMPKPDRGKTEAWYVIDAEPNAVLYAGLKEGVTRDNLCKAIESGVSHECLHVLHPQPGDCVFIPAGTVHALGAGLLIAEIQQASDCTFRLFDWNRVDQAGKSRELHIPQALEVIDFAAGPCAFVKRTQASDGGWTKLVECDKFVLLEAKGPSTLMIPANHVGVLTIPMGRATLECNGIRFALSRGETLLLTAACPQSELTLEPDSTALLSNLPKP
jgi:mannose-6-phosphate isomerase